MRVDNPLCLLDVFIFYLKKRKKKIIKK